MRKTKEMRLRKFKLNIQKFAPIPGISSTNQVISEDVSNELSIINPNFSPLVSYLLKSGKMTRTTSTTISWYSQKIRPQITKLAKALTESDTSIEVEHEDFLVKDSTLNLGDEIVKIVEVDGANKKKATIERGYGKTTSEAHGVKAVVKNLGIFMSEGGTLKKSITTTPVNCKNITGIIYEEYNITETMKHLAVQGQSGYSAQELESVKKKEDLMNIMENKIISSIGFEEGEDRNNHGIKSLIKQYGLVIDAGGQELTKAFFDEVAEQIIAIGGANTLAAGKYFIVAPYRQVNKIDNFNKETIRTSQTERVTGTKITQVITSGGPLNVFWANSLAPTELLVTVLDDTELPHVYPIKEEQGAKTKLGDTYFLHGEFTVKLDNAYQQVLVQNLKD
ncbi:SU10 major capsid protein [Cetobacterium sp.]|uniref:SU10 major capsid protein n=1 Tax=Cetobacterium sp. TaxID=2071632 RepID=UPI003EE5042D